MAIKKVKIDPVQQSKPGCYVELNNEDICDAASASIYDAVDFTEEVDMIEPYLQSMLGEDYKARRLSKYGNGSTIVSGILFALFAALQDETMAPIVWEAIRSKTSPGRWNKVKIYSVKPDNNTEYLCTKQSYYYFKINSSFNPEDWDSSNNAPQYIDVDVKLYANAPHNDGSPSYEEVHGFGIPMISFLGDVVSGFWGTGD